MHTVRVCKEEDALFELLDFIVHLVGLDCRPELREVVDSALSVGSSDHVGRVLPDVLRDLSPRGLDSSNRIG